MTEDLEIVHCIHCGRIWILDQNSANQQDDCPCGNEWYPVSHKVVPGELKLGDGYRAIVHGIK